MAVSGSSLVLPDLPKAAGVEGRGQALALETGSKVTHRRTVKTRSRRASRQGGDDCPWLLPGGLAGLGAGRPTRQVDRAVLCDSNLSHTALPCSSTCHKWKFIFYTLPCLRLCSLFLAHVPPGLASIDRHDRAQTVCINTVFQLRRASSPGTAQWSDDLP